MTEVSSAPHADNPLGLDTTADAYFLPLGGGVYQPTIHVQGAWQPIEQHVAPVVGLLAHRIEQEHPREDLLPARYSVDILGMIPAQPSTVTTRVVRPGRTIELTEGVVTIGGREVVRLRAWRLAHRDTTQVAGGFWEDEGNPLPDPRQFPSWGGSDVWAGGYIASLEIRRDPASRPGRGRAWMRTTHPLVEGEPVSSASAYLGLVDTANGVAARVPPTAWIYPNVELTIHLFRTPRLVPTQGWIGFDTEVVFGEGGLGLTASRLYDEHGAVGRCGQQLTLRPTPAAPGS